MHNNSPDLLEGVLAPEVPQIDFGAQLAPQPCSYNECKSGHRWAPTFALVPCPGCNTPFLAQQKVNCPYCNEPCIKTVLRRDFIPRGGGAAQRCKGHQVNGESLDVEMVAQGWKELEERQLKLFEAR